MYEPLTFRPDLYRGTARFYDEFRLPYPPVLVDDLLGRVSADGTGRLLDLACGPGTATFALAGHFAEVTAVDLEAEAIEYAANKAVSSGVRNVTWHVGRAEDVPIDDPFDVVTIGTAYHRLDRALVAARTRSWLRPGGHLALLWSSTPLNSSATWRVALADTVVGWMDRAGTTDRVPPQLQEHLEEHPHVDILRAAGLEILGRYEFVVPYEWTVDSVIGFVYSTSLLPRDVLGDEATAFESDVRECLLELDDSGRFPDDVSFAYDLARNPT